MKNKNNITSQWMVSLAVIAILLLSVSIVFGSDSGRRKVASYNYNPAFKIDPFKPLIEVSSEKKKDKKSGQLTPLERFSIEEFNLVGIVWSGNQRIAGVEDSRGKFYVLKRGTRIGLNEGRVVKIFNDKVIVEERVRSSADEIKPTRVVLKLTRDTDTDEGEK